MAKAELLFYRKRRFDDGAIAELVIWIVPKPVRGSRHSHKYSLFYGAEGRRLVGYDNEAGKGDHRRYGDSQEPYPFSSVEDLIADFLADITALRGGKT